MPQRKYTKSKKKDTKQAKRIVIPIDLESYQGIVEEGQAFRQKIDELIEKHPELFPQEINQGYQLHGKMPFSKKMPEVQLRRIELKKRDEAGKLQVYTVAPCDILPYMTGDVSTVEKALFLCRFGVPDWALTYVFGRNDMYWYRLMSSFGKNEIVGTTVKHEESLPIHLLADEKHTRFHGEKAYIATTVGNDCVLGASISLSAGTTGLQEAYGHFKAEAQAVSSDYQPETVNIDGWHATQSVWQTLFPTLVIIQCFLHAFIKIRSCGKRLGETYTQLKQSVWDIYKALEPAEFLEKVADLRAWTTLHAADMPPSLIEAINKLCAKSDSFLLIYDHPAAYRTSNMIDRHMEPLSRWLDSARYFHGHLLSAEWQVRGWAILHNFWPYCPRAKISQLYQSPAHKLNGFVYRDHWLENLLVSTSLQSFHLSNKKR